MTATQLSDSLSSPEARITCNAVGSGQNHPWPQTPIGPIKHVVINYRRVAKFGHPEVKLGDEEFSYQLLTIVRPQPTRITLQVRANRF